MKDVFISYKAEEFDEAYWVKSALESNGISCWMAPMCIPGGSSYASEIPPAIRQCKIFVLMLSEKSQSSKWIPRELDQAINDGKTILPFMLDECDLKDDFKFYLTNVQRYPAYENKKDALDKMLKDIKGVLGIEDSAEETKVTEKDSKQEIFAEEKETVRKEKENKPKAPKVKKEKKNPFAALLSKLKAKDKKVFIIIGCVLLAVIIAAAVCISVISSRIVIAGEKFDKYYMTVRLENKELTFEDLEKFNEFNDLYAIYLTNCTLPSEDISDLTSNVSYTLSLDNCGLTDEHLKTAEFNSSYINTIILDNNPQLTDLSPLSAVMGNITDLSFNNCAVNDIGFLKDGKKLKVLSAAQNKIMTLLPLTNCTKLTSVDISGNRVDSLSGLEGAIYLEVIKANDNQIKSLDGISNASLLKTVELSGNAVSDISVLNKSSVTLKTVDISGNGISDISPLKYCTEITVLKMDNNKIETLADVSALTKLTTLTASNNEIFSIEELANCNLLTYIDLSYNEIYFAEGLNLPETEYGIYLDLSHNVIVDLDIPAVKYKYLAIYGNEIEDISCLNTTKGNTVVLDCGEYMDFDGFADSEYYNYYIIGCPLDIQVAIRNLLGSSNTYFVTESEFLSEYKK